MSDAFSGVDTVRLPLPGEDWVEVKTELTYGEDKILQGYAMRAVGSRGDDSGPEYERWEVKRLTTWIVDWSLTKGDKPVPVSEASVRALKPRLGAAISAALNDHIEGVLKNADGAQEAPSPATTTETS